MKNQYDNLYIVGKQWEEACKQREEIVRECAKIYPKLKDIDKKRNQMKQNWNLFVNVWIQNRASLKILVLNILTYSFFFNFITVIYKCG